MREAANKKHHQDKFLLFQTLTVTVFRLESDISLIMSDSDGNSLSDILKTLSDSDSTLTIFRLESDILKACQTRTVTVSG